MSAINEKRFTERDSVSTASAEEATLSTNDREKDVERSEKVGEQYGNTANTYNYKDDPENPLNWSKAKKNIGLAIVSFNAFIGYFSSAVYMPATRDIMAYFDTNLTVINATIALFILMNAIAPLFWAPLSERIGRRWVYITAMFFYTVCTIVCGVSTNIGLFFAFRLLQGIFGSAGQAVGGGSVSDLFEPQERGKAMGIYMLSTILGPAIAPVIGGYIDLYLGWRWIFYIKTIMGGVLTILNFLLLKETLYVPEFKRPAAPTNFSERLERLKFNPFASLELLLQPEVLLACIPMSIAFGWFYFVVTILSPTYGEIYHMSTGSIGLCFLATGAGNILGAIFAGATTDRLYARAVRNNGGVAKKELRLRLNFIGVPFLVAGAIMYGWFLHARLHFMGPLVVLAMLTFGMLLTITVTNTYLVDANHTKAASAVSASNFTRCLCGMIFSLVSVQIRGSLGDGWSYTFMALMCLVAYVVCIPIVIKYGEGWRQRRVQ